MRSKFFGIVLLVFFLFSPLDLYASHAVVFGPDLFIRDTGPPVVEEREFFVPASGQAILRIDNGPEEFVSSAVIMLNGAVVVGPNQFNQNVYIIEVPVAIVDGLNSYPLKRHASPISWLAP